MVYLQGQCGGSAGLQSQLQKDPSPYAAFPSAGVWLAAQTFPPTASAVFSALLCSSFVSVHN